MEYETDSNEVLYVRVDRTRKLPLTVLLRALGYGTNAQIEELLGEDPRLSATLDKDNTNSEEEGLLEIYKRLRPGNHLRWKAPNSLFIHCFLSPKDMIWHV